MKTKLDLGCGDLPEHWLEDAITLDMFDYGQDITHNMCDVPWPIESNSFDFVQCKHVLEHIQDGMDFIGILNEMWRVSKPGATLSLEAPHFPSSPNYYRDPTHCRQLNEYSFELFYVDTKINVGDGYGITCKVEPVKVWTDANRDCHWRLRVVK